MPKVEIKKDIHERAVMAAALKTVKTGLRVSTTAYVNEAVREKLARDSAKT